MSLIFQPRTIGELLRRLGDIPADRVRFNPPLGQATKADVVANRMCELVEGVLVEKATGWMESFFAARLIRILGNFVDTHHLGAVTAPDCSLEILANLVRLPDVAFFSWQRLPKSGRVVEAAPAMAPDLAVEILSRSNTAKEMARKRNEYFQAGVRLVWIIDPELRTAQVFTSPESSSLLSTSDSLTGGDVLPGFSLQLADFFAELDAHGEASKSSD